MVEKESRYQHTVISEDAQHCPPSRALLLQSIRSCSCAVQARASPGVARDAHHTLWAGVSANTIANKALCFSRAKT